MSQPQEKKSFYFPLGMDDYLIAYGIEVSRERVKREEEEKID